MISRSVIEYLKSMADNYDLELTEMRHNETIIEILKRQEACIESLLARNVWLKDELAASNNELYAMLPNYLRGKS